MDNNNPCTFPNETNVTSNENFGFDCGGLGEVNGCISDFSDCGYFNP